MPARSITLPSSLIKPLLETALTTPEVEVCGLIGHRPEAGYDIYPVANVAQHPQSRFELDPAGQIAAMRTMREKGETLFAIYHSHPDAPARPSTTDIEQAAYPEALNLIISLQDRDAPEVRGWWIRGGDAREAVIVIA
ncbi:metal-dependent proteiase [Thiohalobacter thiocyanaticus]|uniref:Metal-dependent proteiase n=1 Tax=Thiohalobacter thiocyanaticus TaxID=585455 RepID=A0A1Z4VUL6_9GAMM|nr:M67 family metallopeptidase [Thiohalobacter thiocyanaticus]BAZ95203.1 metal-dependent proteiase [Thiohalobacter thiocyanaticus]